MVIHFMRKWIMSRKLLWLDDLQWETVIPHMPTRKKRGLRRQKPIDC